MRATRTHREVRAHRHDRADHDMHDGPPGHAHGRMRHGDVRTAILLALAPGPAHGYEVGQRLLQVTEGAWQPSPGSTYPILQALADEDLVTFEERDQKRVYTLTRQGRALLRGREERGEAPPWAAVHGGAGGPLREAVVGLKMAAKQVSTVGTADQRERATAIVVEARRRLYELLAKG